MHAKLAQNITCISVPDLIQDYAFFYIIISSILTHIYDANSEQLSMFLDIWQGYFSKQIGEQIYEHPLYIYYHRDMIK